MNKLSVDTIEYLASLAGKVPNVRVGLGHDGQRLGLVCFSLVDDKNSDPIAKTVTNYVGRLPVKQEIFNNAQAAFVWYADLFEGISAADAMTTIDQIVTLASDQNISTVPIYARGLSGVPWSFAKQARRSHEAKIVEFEKKAYGRWQPEEVVGAVIDDLYAERIRPAPEFRNRPEFEILNSVLRNFKLIDQMDPLAEAAFYGFGYWSALQQRQKWSIGGSNFRVY